ncbi:MAG: cation:proton antiporter, partial [Bacteroidales bacterium]|nr:cation:proton antiporter [Bacteroidales bacterium]
MSDEMNLVRDLAVILISAGVFTIISKALKQPLVLGYILAGFLIGPHVKFFFNISSAEAVQQWSEIGVIFMMFGLGLEFSFKKLLKVGSGALVTAGAKFIGVFILGFVTGEAMSWTIMESIFLGGLLSMSSTAVVLKSYEDMGLKDRPYAPLVFGTLVVEDLIAILLMVLLSTMAVSNRFAGGEMLFNLGKLVFFLILWFIVGLYLIPMILKKARSYINDEILLIVSIGLCFGMVTFATSIGFSSALGAFVMGSILAETIESEHIQSLVHPIKDLFAAIFFVSVGMMVAPDVILANWGKILIITILVYVTHILFSAVGIIMTGNGLKNGVYTGFSLAQLGEFGFIIAGVGTTLGVMRGFIYPVIIAVSVLTTFTTPYMIRLAGPAHRLLQVKLPPQWIDRINQLEINSRRSEEEVSEWKKLLKAFFMRVVLYGVILLAIIIGARTYLDPLVNNLFESWKPIWRSLIYVGTTILVMSPFLYGLAVSTGSINTHGSKLLQQKESNRWPLLALILVRIFIAIGIVLAVISSRFNLAGWTIVMIVIGGIFLFLFARHGMHKYPMLEKQFLANLKERESEQRRRAPI